VNFKLIQDNGRESHGGLGGRDEMAI